MKKHGLAPTAQSWVGRYRSGITAPADDKALGDASQLRQETCKVSGAEQTPSSLVKRVCFTRSRRDVAFYGGLRAGGAALPVSTAQEAPS